MSDMSSKLILVLPELILFLGSVIVAILGLSRSRTARSLVPGLTILLLAIAFVLVPAVYRTDAVEQAGLLMPMLGKYVKMIICVIGISLALIGSGFIDRRMEEAIEAGRARFDPLRVIRGEFFAFFLLSLTGAMLVCNANDLIWMFLALELASLPTYVMVALSRRGMKPQEAAFKYFFLGAVSAALFLYGFALLYGGTGTIVLVEIQDVLTEQAQAGDLSSLAILGMILALLGIGFKMASVPMHFYAPDVYEGAAAPVTAFLAFVPKVTGVLAIIILLGTFGWSLNPVPDADGVVQMQGGLPTPITAVLWMIAVLTMTLGNVGALLQKSIKRMMAYSSISHSGYLLIGVIAGVPYGLNAVLFYILAYGITSSAAFAVLASLQRNGEDLESLEDLSGLRARHPWMAACLAIAAGSLIGLPPLLGFWAKLYIFIAGIDGGQLILVIIACFNSAISAYYYLRLVGLPLMGPETPRSEAVQKTPVVWPRLAAVVCSACIVILPVVISPLVSAADEATEGYRIGAQEIQLPQPVEPENPEQA